MRILLLGVGMQGKAALDDLYRSDIVEELARRNIRVTMTADGE